MSGPAPTGPLSRGSDASTASLWRGIPEWMAWPKEGTWIDRSEAFFSNQGPKVIMTTAYVIACALAFQYGFHFAIDERYPDLRRYISPVGRGCGLCLDLNCALLLLPMCRALITWLRGTRMASLVSFDDNLAAHRTIANVIVALTCIHGGGQAVNYYLYYDMTPGIFGLKSVFISGIALTVILFAIVFTSLDCVRRRRKFEVFYYTHFLFVLFYPGLVVHGLRHGKPTCWMFIVVPALMYFCDRMYRTCSAFKVKTKMTVVEVRSAKVLHIAVRKPFEYKAGQYCELRVPCVSGSEWHPFTISSSPLDQFMEFDIKAAGNWTDELYRRAAEGVGVGAGSRGAPKSPLEGMRIDVKGPFGAPAEHFGQFDDIVLISSGIGATPFASVCKNIAEERRERARAVSDTRLDLSALAEVAASGPAFSTRDLRAPSAASGYTAGAMSDSDATRSRVDSAAPYVAPEEMAFDWRHPAWPFSGQCGCSPLRVALQKAPVFSGQRLATLSGERAAGMSEPLMAPSSGSSVPMSPAAMVLHISPFWLTVQRYLRTVTTQFVLILMWMVTATMAIVILISSGEYYLTCILLDELHTDVTRPPWAVQLEMASETIFIIIALAIVAGIVVDVACVGFTRFWSVTCLRHQVFMVLPGCLLLLVFNSLMSWDIWRPALSIHYVIIAFSKLMLVIPLIVRVHHLTHAAMLTGHQSHSVSRLKSVRFYWVNRHSDAQEWLLPDIARLERSDADGLFSFHVYVTRAEGEVRARWEDYELRNRVKTHRPKWNKIFRQLHEHYAPGSVVGVFFCGTPALAKVLQQVCTTCSSSSVQFRFKKENF